MANPGPSCTLMTRLQRTLTVLIFSVSALLLLCVYLVSCCPVARKNDDMLAHALESHPQTNEGTPRYLAGVLKTHDTVATRPTQRLIMISALALGLASLIIMTSYIIYTQSILENDRLVKDQVEADKQRLEEEGQLEAARRAEEARHKEEKLQAEQEFRERTQRIKMIIASVFALLTVILAVLQWAYEGTDGPAETVINQIIPVMSVIGMIVGLCTGFYWGFPMAVFLLFTVGLTAFLVLFCRSVYSWLWMNSGTIDNVSGSLCGLLIFFMFAYGFGYMADLVALPNASSLMNYFNNQPNL